jgi:hypothetical protein
MLTFSRGLLFSSLIIPLTDAAGCAKEELIPVKKISIIIIADRNLKMKSVIVFKMIRSECQRLPYFRRQKYPGIMVKKIPKKGDIIKPVY